MRWLGLLVVVLVLSLPAPAHAQSQPHVITPADLVGTWARSNNTWFLIIRPDSTFGYSYYDDFHKKAGAGDTVYVFKRWRYLRGDTIVFQANGACINGIKTCKATDTGKDYCWNGSPEDGGATGDDCYRGEPGYHITLKDETFLTLTPLGATNGDFAYGNPYRRLDAATPLPPQFLADLVGTWIGVADARGKVDTIYFRPDSTSNFRTGNKRRFGQWHHLRGDTLWTAGGPHQVTLKDQQLLLTSVFWGMDGTSFGSSSFPEVYTRAEASKSAP